MGLQNREWGFESLLPCQSFAGRGGERNGREEEARAAMATQAVKVNNEGREPSEFGQKVSGTVQNAREFLREVRVEMKQVTWPSREDVISTTGVVIVAVAFFGVFLWIVDLGVERAVRYILKMFGV